MKEGPSLHEHYKKTMEEHELATLPPSLSKEGNDVS